MRTQKKAATIDEYIAAQPEAFRGTLAALCAAIRSAAPKATESISYGVPCFNYHYMLVGIGVSKKYCSFYTMTTQLAEILKEDLAGIQFAGTTIHFLPGEKLPVALIKKIVKIRLHENELRAFTKKR